MAVKLIALGAFALLAACGQTPPPATVSEKVVIRETPVPARCPSTKEYDRLVAMRPVPLRDQPKPIQADSKVDKVAATGMVSSQLGKYEAEGALADQVFEALSSCQKLPEVNP